MKQFIYESGDNELVSVDNQGEPDYPAKKGFDYVAEADTTASGMYNGAVTPLGELADDLRIFYLAAEKLNKHKKVLFRGQTRDQAGFPSIDMGGMERVESMFPAFHADLLHGIIGVATESGELAEIAYLQLTLGHAMEVSHVREEIGDVLWYITRLVKWADTTFLTEMKRNIAKLRTRHGAAGFNKERDMNRDLSVEKTILEGE